MRSSVDGLFLPAYGRVFEHIFSGIP